MAGEFETRYREVVARHDEVVRQLLEKLKMVVPILLNIKTPLLQERKVWNTMYHHDWTTGEGAAKETGMAFKEVHKIGSEMKKKKGRIWNFVEKIKAKEESTRKTEENQILKDFKELVTLHQQIYNIHKKELAFEGRGKAQVIEGVNRIDQEIKKINSLIAFVEGKSQHRTRFTKADLKSMRKTVNSTITSIKKIEDEDKLRQRLTAAIQLLIEHNKQLLALAKRIEENIKKLTLGYGYKGP